MSDHLSTDQNVPANENVQRTSRLRGRQLGLGGKVARILWQFVWTFLYRPTPRLLHPWRCFLLRMFGAKLGAGVHPYPSARIWAPWNLKMGNNSCLSEWVDCYSVDKITIGAGTTVSQYSFLCTASHDFRRPDMPLVTAPITLGSQVWITADVFLAPGVTVGDGAVVTARSSVFSDVPSWTVASGNPAVVVKKRYLEAK
jgi:putative colanic acid biosynthesis acetyltransferase WcaF